MSFIQNNWMLILVAFLSGAMLVWPLVQRRFSTMKDIGNLNATHLINHKDAVLLDVRETKEYEGGRLPNAVHIPLSQLDGRAAELVKSRAGRWSRTAPAGTRSRMAAARWRSRASRTSTTSWVASTHGRAPGSRWKDEMQPRSRCTRRSVCPYCIQAERLLRAKGVAAIAKIRVDLDPRRGGAMMEKTGRRTVPQIYIGDFHVGGYEDLVALDRSGRLEALLHG